MTQAEAKQLKIGDRVTVRRVVKPIYRYPDNVREFVTAPGVPGLVTVTGIRHAPMGQIRPWEGDAPAVLLVSGSQLVVLFRATPTSRERLALPEDVEVAP